MKKTAIITAIVIALGGAALWFFSQPRGVSIGGVDLGGSERQWLAERSIDFVEDIQFKDFQKASTYHLEKTQKERDIPGMIQRLFRIRHEVLDITGYEVLEVDLDRSKTRGRVKVQIFFRVLGDKVVRDNMEAKREGEMILYWFRAADGTWTMELESSLR